MHGSVPFLADPVQVLSAIAEKLRAEFHLRLHELLFKRSPRRWSLVCCGCR
jgi:hypothetical protein